MRHWRSRIGASGDLHEFSRLRLDVAENPAAAFDLDLAVVDRRRDPAGRLDQEQRVLRIVDPRPRKGVSGTCGLSYQAAP